MINKEFDSLTALAAFLKSTPRANNACDSSTANSADDWTGYVDFDGAMDMASKGGHWPEGARNMQQAHIEVSSCTASECLPEVYDVKGHTLDIDEYLSGSPECWVSEDDEDADRAPILSVGIASDALANVTDRSMMLYGASALSIVDDLESRGYRVEIWATWASRFRGSLQCSFRTLVKAADEQWSPSQVAFSLCHPAFNRRLMFALAERFPELADMTRMGYGGLPKARQIKELYDFDVYIPGYDENVRTPEAALHHVYKQFNEAMKEAA